MHNVSSYTSQKSTKTKKSFAKGFITCLLLIIVLSFLKGPIIKMVEGTHRINQNVLMKALEGYCESKGNAPKSIGELTKEINQQDLEQCFDAISYYPEAWGNPGEILLRSERMITGSYVATLGDGSRIIFSHWDSHKLKAN